MGRFCAGCGRAKSRRPRPLRGPRGEYFLYLLILLVLSVLLGCDNKAETAAPRAPLEISALTVAPRDVPVWFEYVGQTESSYLVEIRARIDGYLEKRLYKEGSLVKAGEVMFLMDRRPFEAALQKAKGQLAMQEARRANAAANLARMDLAEKKPDEARKAGAKILKPAAKLQWGGYGGSFADPDGYIWNIGYSAVGADQPYAE